MRTRKKTWAAGELETNALLVREPELLGGKWRECFKNDNPVHLEIGCGKGRFIVQMAANNPLINYVAIEKEEMVIVSGMRRAREAGLENVKFVLGDASRLEEYFIPGEIKRIYINFCDPWPNRKKWQKRRLTHIGFLDIYKRLFSESGEIFFKTDNMELFDFSLEQFVEREWSLREVCRDLHNSGCEGNIMTEYEEKFSQRGMPIFRCVAYIV